MDTNNPKSVCFYGAKEGMTPRQEMAVLDELAKLAPIAELRHCDTPGAAEKVHDTVLRDWKGITVRIFPSDNPNARAFCAAGRMAGKYEVVIERESPLGDASRRALAGVDVLVAAPHDDLGFSGTWTVIRVAKKLNVRKIITVMPDGEVRRWPDPSLMPRRPR